MNFLIIATLTLVVAGIAALVGLVALAFGLVFGITAWLVGLLTIYTAIPLLIPLICEVTLILALGPLLFYFAWYWIG